jgi:bifunctional non-homologous end joining protein LigD
MLAISWPAPFDDDDWSFEVKWDGYRVVVAGDEGRVRARSRRGLDLLEPFPELAGLDIPSGVVLDGEIVAFDEKGRPSFSLLQQRTGFGGRGTGARVGVNLVVFDLLFRDEPLIVEPYERRRSLLADLDLPSPVLVPEPTPAAGTSLYEAVSAQGMEGIVGKRLGSPYQPGRRSGDWRKISMRHNLQAVVGGYLPGAGGRSGTFGSVLVGLYKPDGLHFIAAVGSGFDDASLRLFSEALSQLERPTSPFANQVIVPGGRPIWVEPGIVIRVEYKEWTHDDHLRAPVYKGVVQTDPETVTWTEEGRG